MGVAAGMKPAGVQDVDTGGDGGDITDSNRCYLVIWVIYHLVGVVLLEYWRTLEHYLHLISGELVSPRLGDCH